MYVEQKEKLWVFIEPSQTLFLMDINIEAALFFTNNSPLINFVFRGYS